MVSNAPVFDAVRPWLDAQGFTPARIAALDAACAALRAGTPPPPVPQPHGDPDRFLRLFQHLASPQAKPEDVAAMAASFAAHAPAFGQDASKPRIAEFVAQIANETGGFRVFNENLNYSASRLRQVWPNRVSAALAAQIAHNPEAIANVVYQRTSMGNTHPGDGWRYRGRGALQLTFRNNYRLFGLHLGIDLEGNPDLAADPAVSVQIALEFFKVGHVNAAIDRGDFREARRITNGAALGLESVATLRAKALQILG
jgi:putative chitinase